MPRITHMLFTENDDAFITAFVPGAEKPLTASTSSHPNFAEIVQRVKADDPSVIDLFDLSVAVSQKFDVLSDRVSVKGGKVYFDGDEVDNSLTDQIIRFMDEDVEDWNPLVNFMENVAANPQEHSREQLYDWLRVRDFTITEDGCFIAYKGVSDDLKSVRSGPGIVNGEAVNGRLDNSPGNIVEIARSLVQHDPAVGCASGLHVANYRYAESWGGSVTLKVKVNPRDVVSVPTETNAEKIRVCRYQVIEKVDSPVASALDSLGVDPDYWDEEDEDACPVCGSLDCPWRD